MQGPGVVERKKNGVHIPSSTFLFCFGTGPYCVALANCVDQAVLELRICVTMPVFIVCFKY